MERMSAEDFRKKADSEKTEKEVQSECIQYLRMRGWKVPAELLETPTHLCGIYLVCGTTRRKGDHQGTMQTPGISDLWLSPPGWKTWIGIECKRPVKFSISPEQVMLADAGLTHIVRSVSELQNVLETVCSHTTQKERGKHTDD